MPIERVAGLADIHGNLPALEAVLGDVEAARPDRIVLDGDLVDGPPPDETFRCLEALGPSAIRLRGNGDRWPDESHAGRFTHADPGPDVTLKRSLYDIEDAAVRMRRGGMPAIEALIDTYVRRTPGDAEALAAYHAIRKRQRTEGFARSPATRQGLAESGRA